MPRGGPRAGHPAARPQLPPFTFDIRRLGAADLITGASSVVFLIALFMPWFGVSGTGFSRIGLAVHGYLALALLTALALLAYLLLRAGWDALPFTVPVAHAQLLLFGTTMQLLLVLVGFLIRPDGFGWDFGSYLSLLSAMVACGASAWPAVRSLQSAG